MQCPYCDGEMQRGYIKCERPFVWSPNKKIHLINIKRKEDIQLSQGFWDGCYVEAYVCPACKKMILDIPDAK